MAVTQTYYGARDDEHFSHPERSSHRVVSTGGYYERAVPYTYYDTPRHDPRPEYGSRQMTHTIIHDPHESQIDHHSGHSRRRIAVACSRCRRRKIKCTGDPGDGSGCQSCRNSASDIATCNFIRVKSTQYFFKDAEGFPTTSCMAPQPITGPVQNTPAQGYEARLSLPHLHTRPSFTVDYEQYDASPIEGYNFSATLPRQDSFIGSFNGENYRSWPTTTGSMSAPTTATYYEPHPSYPVNGGLPSYQPIMPYTFSTMTRVPSVTAESPLSMGSLHSSLPIQTAQERRLPVPYSAQRSSTPPSNTNPPEIRPLGGSFDGPRDHINGIHSRNAMPWSTDGNMANSSSESVNETDRPTRGLTTPTPITQAPSNSTAEPVLGYQFSHANSNGNAMATSSPQDSPSSAPSQPGIYHRASSSSSSELSSMPPPARWSTSYQPVSTYNTTGDDSHYGSRVAPLTSLYSFSSETTGAAGRSFPTSNERERTPINCHSYTPLRHPQAMHAASFETLRRHASPPISNRISMSSLNGRYA